MENSLFLPLYLYVKTGTFSNKQSPSERPAESEVNLVFIHLDIKVKILTLQHFSVLRLIVTSLNTLVLHPCRGFKSCKGPHGAFFT